MCVALSQPRLLAYLVIRALFVAYSGSDFVTARSELRKVLFLALWLFVYEISREVVNRFAPNSHGRRVWYRAPTSLNVKVKGQSSRSQGTKHSIFGPFRRPACGLFHKTSPASSLICIWFVFIALYSSVLILPSYDNFFFYRKWLKHQRFACDPCCKSKVLTFGITPSITLSVCVIIIIIIIIIKELLPKRTR